jgi:hypothetical protein
MDSQQLPGLPTGPLPPHQHADALRRAAAVAEQRIKLGAQLFKAAEARVAQYQELVDEIKSQQEQMRQQMQEEVQTSLAKYDDLVGSIDDSFTERVHVLEDKIDSLTSKWEESQKRIEQMMHRAESMLDQGRIEIDETQQLAMQERDEPESVSASDFEADSDEMTIGELQVASIEITGEHPAVYTHLMEKLRQRSHHEEVA